MGRAELKISAELLMRIAQQTEVSFYRVIKNPVPPDARLLGVGYDHPNVLVLQIESPQLDDGSTIEPIFEAF